MTTATQAFRSPLEDGAPRALGEELDAGLVRGIGTGGLAANIINYVVGASIYAVPAAAAALVGRWTPIAFVIAAIANAAIAICYAEASSRVAASGGQAAFTRAVFGRYAGFVVGVLTYVSALTAAGAVLAAAADAAAAIVPGLRVPVIRALLIVVWAALLIAINWRGVRSAIRSIDIAVAVKLTPLILFLIVAGVALKSSNLSLPSLPVPAGLGKATLLAVFLFAGVHGPLIAGGEIREPARTLPYGIFLATGFVTALYIGVELVAQGVLGTELAGSKQPLAAAIAHISPALSRVMLIGALLSMLGWTISEVLSAPRLLLAFAREGFLPGSIGQLNVHRVPGKATILHVALMAAIAIVGSFSLLATLAALIMAVLFIAAAVTALRLRMSGVATSGQLMRIPALWPAALLSIAVMTWVAAQATLLQAIGLAAIIGLASITFAIRGRAAGPRFDSGIGANSVG
jgi:APA family basic amino acid/polyamine antiporter